MRPRLGDRGSVTAEFAVALPAILLLLVLCVGTLSTASRQVRLQDAVADASRLIARGDDEGRALALVAAAAPDARSEITRDDDLVCITASVPIGIAAITVPLSATACALAGGR
jgi:Flp pilus assembly protein TadG